MVIFLFISLPATPCPYCVVFESWICLHLKCFTAEAAHWRRHMFVTNLHIWCLGHESEDSMSTLAGRRGMRPKMMMPFDSQPPQRKLKASLFPSAANYPVILGNSYKWSLWLHLILMQKLIYQSFGTLREEESNICHILWLVLLFLVASLISV